MVSKLVVVYMRPLDAKPLYFINNAPRQHLLVLVLLIQPHDLIEYLLGDRIDS